MSSQKLINKSRIHSRRTEFPNCSQNTTKIEGLLFCWKCIEERRKGRNRKFTTCRQLFHHLTICHSGSDIAEYPARDNCIEMLQGISNAIVSGVLK